MSKTIENTPLGLLSKSLEDNTSVLISLRNNHKLVCNVKAFDKHCNMVLENVREFWNEENANGNKALKERFVSKMFLRGDSVVVVLKYDAQA